MRTLTILAGALLLSSAGAQGIDARSQTARPGRFTVEAEVLDGEVLFTIHADKAPVEEVLSRIARHLGRELVGMQDVAATPPVSVFLEARPSDQALNFVAGAAGLRVLVTRETVSVADDTPPFPVASALYDMAETSFLRALRDFPVHGDAAAAELSMAEIQESRSAWDAAVKHYDYLIQTHSHSALVPEAMWRSARHLARLGRLDEAARRFDELATLDRPHSWHSRARLELARVLCQLGDPKRGLYTLDALETFAPLADTSGNPALEDERFERLLVRTRALALDGRTLDALRSLDHARFIVDDETLRPELAELRALTLEHGGQPNEASVAWLRYADVAEEPQRSDALARAADLALDAGDELAALFIAKRAEVLGYTEVASTAANEARLRLELIDADRLTMDDAQRLESARNLLGKGLSMEANRRLEPLWQGRAKLDQAMRLEVALLSARALAAESRIERAIERLRTIAGELEDADERRRIFLLASKLLEDRGRIHEAIAALEGVL